MPNQQNKRNFYDRPLKIGTRGSPLALAQANETRNKLMDIHSLGEAAFEICIISTTMQQFLLLPTLQGYQGISPPLPLPSLQAESHLVRFKLKFY